MMKAVLLVLLAGLAAAYESYEGYKLIDIVPETKSQVEFLHDLLLTDAELDFWEEPSRVGKNVRILVDGDYLEYTLNGMMTSYGLEYDVAHHNIEEVIEKERQEIAAIRAEKGQVFDLDKFNDLAEIEVWLNEQVTTCANAGLICTFSSIGSSVEGRPLWLFTITSAVGATKPIIYIDSIVHAREWITCATTFKIMDRLLNQYGTDPEATQLLDDHEFHFVPIENPDGYDYTWTDYRLWRKNRGDNPGSNCTGTDLNRNFEFRWAFNGASFVPCSNVYCGAEAGDQPETQAVMAHFDSIASRAWAVVSMHAYGYDWMHPWGNTIEPLNDNAPCDLADDHAELFAVAEAAGQAVEDAYDDGRRPWEWGNSCVVIYTATGATEDHAKGGSGIKYGFGLELRGNSFIVDPSEIDISYQEIWAGVYAMKLAIDANPPF